MAKGKRELEFFLDFMSPTAYLAYTQLPGLLDRTGARVVCRPMLTLKLHELTGNRSPMAVPNKARWAIHDLVRFANRYDVPLVLNPHFPLKMLDALHGAIVALDLDVMGPYCDALFDAVWVNRVNPDDRSELRACIDAAGLDAEAILAQVDEPSIHDRLMSNTEEAASRGAFGAPTFFVGESLHFGQDRLDFVEEDLNRV